MALVSLAVPLSACSDDDEPRPPATGPVEVLAPAGARPAELAVCRALVQALPQVVNVDLPRRPVTGDADRTAAWGDPAITLRCGTGPSGSPGIDGSPVEIGLPGARCVLDPDPTQCVTLLQRDTGDGNAFTTYGRTVNVEVDVPDAYAFTALQAMVAALGGLPAEAEPEDGAPTARPSAYPSVSAGPSGG